MPSSTSQPPNRGAGNHPARAGHEQMEPGGENQHPAGRSHGSQNETAPAAPGRAISQRIMASNLR